MTTNDRPQPEPDEQIDDLPDSVPDGTRYEWLDKHIGELVERYESGQSLREIADAFGVAKPTIHRRLQERDVSMRNGGPSYARLENRRDRLVERFVEDQDDINTIATDCRTSRATIRHHLEQAGIDCPPRDPKTDEVDLTPSHISIIEGELLGDGCLHRQKGGCFFQLSTTTESHARRLLDVLPNGLFPPGQPNEFTRTNHFNDEPYTMWTVTSRPQAVFDRLYETWYEVREQNNRKTVPEGYHLDRTALLHWYWGDGNCSIRDRGAPRVCFATHGFPEPDVDHLQSELDQLGYDNYAIRQQGVEDGSGLSIRLRDYDARTFLGDIRPHSTLPAYDHKFPVPDPEST